MINIYSDICIFMDMTPTKPRTIIMGTYGWHPEYLEPVLGRVKSPDLLHFYFGYIEKEKVKTLQKVEDFKDICKGYGSLKLNPVKLDDIFDFSGIVKTMRADIKKFREAGDTIAVFNITGGTKTTCSAALFVCIVENIPALYVSEDGKEIINIPLLGHKYAEKVPGAEREIMEALIAHKDDKEPMSEVRLAGILKKNKSTVNIQVKSLEKKGLIELVHGADGKSRIVKPKESADLLFG